jgi:hypothetical protein
MLTPIFSSAAIFLMPLPCCLASLTFCSTVGEYQNPWGAHAAIGTSTISLAISNLKAGLKRVRFVMLILWMLCQKYKGFT